MRRVAALALALAGPASTAPLCANAAPSAAAPLRIAALGDSIRSKQNEIDATRQRLDQKRGQLRFQAVRAGDLRRQLSETNGEIVRVRATLDAIDAEIRGNERRVAWNQVQLAAAKATLQRHDDALRRRLVDAYERGDLGYLDVLLSSRSFNDFAERWQDIRYLIVANQKAVRARLAAEREVDAKERTLEGERLDLDATRGRERQTQYQLAALATQRSNLVAAAEVQRRSVATEVAQLEELSAQQEAELEAFIRERQREEEARRAAEAAARRRAAQLAGQTLAPAAPEPETGTAFSWPVSGPITSGFGMRSNPMGPGFEMHPGIDIGAPMGATITAAASGRVIFAGWYGGYGNAIIIDHGGATSSLYGHCSQVFVSSGQDVQRGQAIGAVGATGNATGPHLHFEVRVNGVAVDPTSRLR